MYLKVPRQRKITMQDIRNRIKQIDLIKKIKKITIKRNGSVLMVRHIVHCIEYAPQEMFNMKCVDWSSYMPSAMSLVVSTPDPI